MKKRRAWTAGIGAFSARRSVVDQRRREEVQRACQHRGIGLNRHRGEARRGVERERDDNATAARCHVSVHERWACRFFRQRAS
jgi:hypothetical protein